MPEHEPQVFEVLTELSRTAIHEQIEARVDGIAQGTDVSLLSIGAVMHGMADHGHLTRIIDLLEESSAPAETLHSYFEALASGLSDQGSGSPDLWAVDRIMGSQSVNMGTPMQHRLLGHQSPIPRADVGKVFRALTLEHCSFISDQVISARGMLRDDERGRAEYWPEALSLGRYFHALGDSAESAAWDAAH